MKNILIIGLIAMTIISCGTTEAEEKCSCEEIKEKGATGKYMRNAYKKDGNLVTFGEIFDGECETKDAKGNIVEHNTYKNGILIKSEKFELINDELIQILKLTYELGNGLDANFKPKPMPIIVDGYFKHNEYDKYSKINYIKEYKEFENKEVKNHWKINVYEIVTKCYAAIHLNHQDFNKKGYTIYSESAKCAYYPEGDDLSNLLRFGKDQNLPGFWTDANLESEKAEILINNENVSEISSIEETIIGTELYKINDPDGYSNLRDSPDGEILKKVYENETFEIIGEEADWRKVELKDGTIGFIHSSRVQLL